MTSPVNSQGFSINSTPSTAVGAHIGYKVLSSNQSQVSKIALVAALALLALTSVLA